MLMLSLPSLSRRFSLSLAALGLATVAAHTSTHSAAHPATGSTCRRGSAQTAGSRRARSDRDPGNAGLQRH